jgi:hypothetical protein
MTQPVRQLYIDRPQFRHLAQELVDERRLLPAIEPYSLRRDPVNTETARKVAID